MRSAAVVSRSSVCRFMEGARISSVFPRYFSGEGKGRILSEEERAAENIYIQKMEKEKMEKMRQNADRERAEKEKENAEKKPGGESNKG
ncbi:hypothetical protein Nepgr_009707 [Nepenthes gracilis]|uniref:ATPase inhibitor n=1 Tax=Nepenthes gracilis TaxID=150966 RepID=A0AAD3SB88_NEPGR|nr:hypothetical protein Nepgr_009707 [Nepenthes gracilis]